MHDPSRPALTHEDAPRPPLPPPWYFWLEIRERQPEGSTAILGYSYCGAVLFIAVSVGFIFRNEAAAGILGIILLTGGCIALFSATVPMRLRYRRYQRYLDQGTMMTRLNRRRWADDVEAELWHQRPRWTRKADRLLGRDLPEPTWPSGHRNLRR
ncbi:hypothetical protein UG55_10305 [Frankia sp. EI5c]|uniref:hypothetical protein n=1 Tax=Frankia sp. EI5c TaxID=683316 RepID=UPI0007C234F5|nr:hypothetical protein [Frankia sp. EI5c]OAA24361.1 hypothetical protein UG55_10305 [Frankia sp. EI5c]